MTPFKPWEAVPSDTHVAAVLPFAPNWASPPVERLTWKMGAHLSQAGVEHRRNLRREPRQGLEFSTLTLDADVPLLRNLVEGWGANTFAVPLWYGACLLDADVTTADDVLDLDASTATLFQVDGWAIVWAGARDFDVVQIASVGSASITLVDPMPTARAAGMRVAPLQFMQLQDTQGMLAETPGIVVTSWVFEQVPGHAPSLERWGADEWAETFPTGAPAADPRNHFLTFAHNWAGRPDITVSTMADVFDPGIGVLSRRLSVDRTSPQWALDVLLDSREASAALRKFLAAHRGPAVSFWAPSMLRDLGLSEDIAGVTLTVTNNAQHLAPPVLRMGVHITHPGGEVRESVSAITPDSVTLRNDPGAIALADVWRQSWVARCRLAVEGVTIQHVNNRVATVRLPVVAVDVGSGATDIPGMTAPSSGGGGGSGLPTVQWSTGAYTRMLANEDPAEAVLTLSAALVEDLAVTVSAVTANGGFESRSASWVVTLLAGATTLTVGIPFAVDTGGVDLRQGMGIAGAVYTLTLTEASALVALGTPTTATITSV